LDDNQKALFQEWLNRIKNGGGKQGPGGKGWNNITRTKGLPI
jgi:hypothetical protein